MLTELGDAAPFVEYWARREWAHIPMHRDLVESLLDYGIYVMPEHAHVVYLHVGSHVLAPTTVLHGETLAHSLVTVPAVRGRLLRFNGTNLHGVPRPHDVWIRAAANSAHHTHADGGQFRWPTAAEGPEMRRDVLLFNTWAQDWGRWDVNISPPSADDRQQITSTAALSQASILPTQASIPPEARRTWLKITPRPASQLRSISPPDLSLYIDLLDDCIRRGTDETHVAASVSVDVHAAFAEVHTVVEIPVKLFSKVAIAPSAIGKACGEEWEAGSNPYQDDVERELSVHMCMHVYRSDALTPVHALMCAQAYGYAEQPVQYARTQTSLLACLLD